MSEYESAVKALEKAYPKAFTLRTVGGFSTGCIAVDRLTGVGGFPEGSLTEVCGWEASGKTTLCLGAFAAAQRRGLMPVYLDTELGVDLTYAEAIGCDFSDRSKGIYAVPESFEDALKFVDTLLGKVPIIFVDSVAGLVTKQALEGDLGTTEAIGMRARMFSNILPPLIKRCAASKTSVVLVNQLRENIVTDTYAARTAPKNKSQGGRAIPYFAWMRINTVQIKKGDSSTKRISELTGKEEAVPVASEHAAQVLKSKVGVANQSAPWYVRFDPELGIYGVDNVQTILDMAVANGTIQKRGSYYTLKLDDAGEAGAFSAHGEEPMYRHLASDSALIERVAAAVGVDWSLYAQR